MNISQLQTKIPKILSNGWLHRFVRFGYLIRGVLYGTVGLVAIQVAVGFSKETADTGDALTLISQVYQGRYILILFIVGLISYSIWGLIRSVQDYIDKSLDKIAWFNRLGYLISSFSYLLLTVPTYQLILAKPNPRKTDIISESAKIIFDFPFGSLLLIVVGIVIIISGLFQIVTSIKAQDPEDFRSKEKSHKYRGSFLLFAKVGISVRGIVFILVGYFLCLAGTQVSTSSVKNFDNVLTSVYSLPGGYLWLAIIGVGLLFFGIYSSLLSYSVKLD